ncbi:MAG: Spy/CpxP family protein refolding chaperone [Ignavibacteria bacterium]|nr:Spy/CpxP family protein refolding chaperone [Ignavibacteria bacterium]
MSDVNSFNNPPNNPPVKPSNSKRKILISIIVVFVITGIAALGFAKNFYDNHRGGHDKVGFIIGKISKELDLNDEQKAEVEKIKIEIKAKMDENKQNRSQDAVEMENLFRSSSFDKTKALELSSKRDAERQEMKSFMIDELAKFHSILTPDQRNKAADKMKEFREKRSQMHNKWEKENQNKQ